MGSVPAHSRSIAELATLLEDRGNLLAIVPPSPATPADPRASAGPSAVPGPLAGISVGQVEYDSRRVRPGSLFVAVRGARTDGHAFVPAAIASGAAAIVAERPLEGLPVPQLIVRATRPALATAAAWLAGFPARKLGIVGITGTDGKTTTGFLVRAVLEAAGLPSGMSGTVATIAGSVPFGGPSRATTPEAPELQAALAAMVDAGDRFAVVESTSHGLALDRVGEIAYDVAVLTNLTHEHLEFHRTHEAYRAAKLRLFEALARGDRNPEKGWGKTGIVNADDRWAGEFVDATRGAGARLLTYGRTGDADIRLLDVRQDPTELRVEVAAPRWRGVVRLRLAGTFNAYNALAAIAVGEALGLDPEAVRRGLESVGRVPGRMERVPTTLPIAVILDYAHTPNALRLVLDDLGPVARASGGGLVAVFGSAGERDVVKRSVMGRVAGERCRLVIVTDADPRGEDRDAILEQIAAGAEEAGRKRGLDLLVVPDRARAIASALEHSLPGDVVVLAGKGHESTIEMSDGPHAWDERAVAEAAIAARERAVAAPVGGHDGRTPDASPDTPVSGR
jgi:UDP-N-acetylmuramoyl-L-alanyl-D-glutamate--2,6-diaminopimelate ligase